MKLRVKKFWTRWQMKLTTIKKKGTESALVKTHDTQPVYQGRISGRISAASYSIFSSNYDNRHRTMLRFSINTRHLNNSKLSLESYINYTENFVSSDINTSQQNKFLRVYNLSLNYDLAPTISLAFGRKINQKISSIGAIDGIQVEKKFQNYYVGLVSGFRPDIYQFDLNLRLLEYGGYVGMNNNSNQI